ncbi:DUF5655 domain-containing protein [Streptomyces luteireticuli]|uniref:DUF5655 domain-containing protein n=1 Tax=Streptomyces luteireticuli TaxID=173858 RepID=A0ABN0YQ18_9ACTN
MSGLRLFNVATGGAVEIVAHTAVRERHLQELVETNMEALLGVRFLASEYSTGPRHGGRIDTLGIDENGSPVIVEYKRGRDAGVIPQGLFYLSWLADHRAEFQLLVRERLGATAAAQVLWSTPRLICVAESFTRYDVHAVREIQRNIDLVRYHYFGHELLALEPVVSVTSSARERRAVSRMEPAVTLLPGPRVADGPLDEIRSVLDDVLVSLGDDVTQVERKQYLAYRRLKNFACVGRAQQRQVVVYLKVDPGTVDLVPGFTRDVREIGHHGTGALEVRLRSEKDVERAGDLFRLSYEAA